MKTQEEILNRINDLEILLFEADEWVKKSLNNLKLSEERPGLSQSDVTELDYALESKTKIRAEISALSWALE